MGGKLKDLKETASDAVEIIREFGTPAVQESLDKVNLAAKTFKEIIDSLKDPEMIRNIENIRQAVEASRGVATKLESSVAELNKSGVIDEAKNTMKSVQNAANLVTRSTENAELVSAIKEAVKSIRDLVEEMRLTLVASKKSETARDAKQTLHELSNVYKNVRD